MVFKNIKAYRKYYQKFEAGSSDPKLDINFIGGKIEGDAGVEKLGFFTFAYGNSDNEKAALRSTSLNIAADHQAVYELIQNADDAKSDMVLVAITEDYFICINNGLPFEHDKFDSRKRKKKGRVASILNFGQSDKGLEDIGTFGIGFKIIHRLLGEDDGANAIIDDLAGPIVFSWFEFRQLQELLKSPFYQPNGREEENNSTRYPWLFKILYTCFPAAPFEKVQIEKGKYEIPFSEHEYKKFISHVGHEIDKLGEFQNENHLAKGSIFYIPLGKGKYDFIKEHLSMLNKGVSYSFNFLKSLKRIYFQSEKIDHSPIETKKFLFKLDQEPYISIKPRVEREIEITFAYFKNYHDSDSLVIENALTPNFYNYFSMEEECNRFRFIVHCNAFDMNSNRRALQTDSDINKRLLPHVANEIKAYILEFKDKNASIYRNLFAAILLSPSPNSKNHIREYFFKPLTSFLPTTIPLLSGLYSSDAEKVKIKKTTLNITLEDFGLTGYNWYYWLEETDFGLIESSKTVLGIESWDLKNIIEEAQVDDINKYLEANKNTVSNFLEELCKEGSIRETVIEILLEKIKFISFGDELLTLPDVVGKSEYLIGQGFVSNERVLLKSIGFKISDIDYDKESLKVLATKIKDKYLTDVLIFERIKTRIELDAEEKINQELRVQVFNAITNNSTGSVFLGVGPDSVGKLKFFKNENEDFVPVVDLISPDLKLPNWLKGYLPQPEGINGDKYFIKENEIYNKIIIPNWNTLTKNEDKNTVAEFYTGVKKYYDLLTDDAIVLKSKKYLFSTNGWLNSEDNFYYHPDFHKISRYENLSETFVAISEQPLVYSSILDFLKEEPFKTEKKDLSTTSFLQCCSRLEIEDIDLLLSLDAKSIFEYYTVQSFNNNWWIVYETSENLTLQIQSDSTLSAISSQLKDDLDFNLLQLPKSLSAYDAHLDTDEIIINKIISKVTFEKHLTELLALKLSKDNFISLLTKKEFFIELDPFAEYTIEDNQFKLFEYFSKFYTEDDFDVSLFTTLIRIKKGDEWNPIPENLPKSDTLRYEYQERNDSIVKEYKLSEIIPNKYEFIGYLESLKKKFTTLEIKISPINKALGLSSKQVETDTASIFSSLLEELNDGVIERTEQLKFITVYLRNTSLSNNLKIKVLGTSNYVLLNGNHFVLKASGEFTDPNRIIDLNHYTGFDEIITINGTTSISREPRALNQSILLAGVKEVLEKEEEKVELLNFFFTKWRNSASLTNSFSQYSKDQLQPFLNKIGIEELQYFYPDCYALSEEILPKHISSWVTNNIEDQKLKSSFLTTLKVNTEEASPTIFRKYLLKESSFDMEILNQLGLQDITLILDFIVQGKIDFEAREEDFQRIIDRMNDTIIEEENKTKIIYSPDTQTLENNSNLFEEAFFDKWKEEAQIDWNIYIYKEEHCPEFMQTNKTGDYAFSTVMISDCIYLNESKKIFIGSNKISDLEIILKDAGISSDDLMRYNEIKSENNNDDDEKDNNPQKENEVLGKIKKELEDLGINPSPEVQADINYGNMLLAWRYLLERNYNVSAAVFDKGFIRDVEIYGEKKNFLVRSGAKGIFYLREFNWTDLQKTDYYLLVKTKSGIDNFKMIRNQQELLDEFSSDVQYNVLRLSKDIGIDTLTEMMNTLTINKQGKGHFIFRTGKDSPYESIFAQIDSSQSENVPAGLAEEENF